MDGDKITMFEPSKKYNKIVPPEPSAQPEYDFSFGTSGALTFLSDSPVCRSSRSLVPPKPSAKLEHIYGIADECFIANTRGCKVVQGQILTFSFQVMSHSQIVCRIHWEGMTDRFLATDIDQVLPDLFNMNHGMYRIYRGAAEK